MWRVCYTVTLRTCAWRTITAAVHVTSCHYYCARVTPHASSRHRRHRELCEVGLEGLGMSQVDVVEWIAEEAVKSVTRDAAAEVHELYEGIVESLLADV